MSIMSTIAEEHYEETKELRAQLAQAKDRGDLLLDAGMKADAEWQEAVESLKSTIRSLTKRLALHRWIPVGERLPCLDDRYAYDKGYEGSRADDGTLDVWALDDRDRVSVSNFYPKMQVWNGPSDDSVTHWKPIILPKDG